jgi:3-hydroxyisobutyrate dehydrogenase
MTLKVGFVGLGAIGRPMAMHVARTFETTVWNRTTERARQFAAQEAARWERELPALGGWADVIVTCLPTSVEVREVVERIGDAWRDGQLVIDATSGDPAASRELAERLEHRGVGFVDAPVSGGTSGAEAAKLTTMLGGEDRWVARARDVVSAYSDKVVHVGPAGAGHAVKALNQALLAINILASGEALAALVKLGVSGSAALAVINASSGRSNVTENLLPERVLSRAWLRTFRLALLDKDVGIALKILEDTGIPDEVIRATKAAFAEGRASLGEEADHVELIKEIEQAAGVEIS